MGRPPRGRRIEHQPDARFFKPAGVPAAKLKVSVISLDELEAMRLVDGEELKQVDAAEKMGISQSTIARVLASGRKKVALALAHGQALRLKAGAAPLDFSESPVKEPEERGRGRGFRRRGGDGGRRKG